MNARPDTSSEASTTKRTCAYHRFFDADEEEFVFSFFGPAGEVWFQFSLSGAKELADGLNPVIEGRPAE